MSTPQIRLIGAVPRVVLARLQMFFNTNKTFLLPTALPVVQKLRQIYADNSPGKLLVVGHADTAGDAAYNDKLSLERAKSTIAYLEDDFQTWLDCYGAGVESQKRWGKVEDHLMIISMHDFDTKPKGQDAVSWYQDTRHLTVDGQAGTETRTKLIQEYMALDGASLEDSGIKIDAVAHGCGENFPLDDADDTQLAVAPADNKPDPIDRRVELFFFDDDFGIVPAPPGDNSGPGSTQYPAWRKRVEETVELSADDVDGPKVTFIEMADGHFRTDSAVVLPEGENPDQSGAHQAFTSVGVIATALRFNDEHPGRTLLVAGHTDTTADPAFNQPLSEERAQVTLAMLKGGDDSRENFKNLAQGRHTVADIKQILSWVSGALTGFACDPGKIDDNLATASGPVVQFQNAYNAQRATIAPNSTDDLEPDGSVGPLTWGAFFDCYELALQQELGEDAAGVQALRDKLVFADPQHEFLGFSEYFPIDELGVDNFRSQTNRRVEILFFERGEEPDIEHAADDPETSDLYLPGHYERTAMAPRGTAKTSNNLDVSTRLDDEPVELHVLADGDRTVNIFPQSSGVVNGGGIHFVLDPEQLPNPVRFVIRRGEQFEDHGQFFDPISLRDDLSSGQLASATTTITAQDEPDDRVAGPGAGAGTSTPSGSSSFGVDAQFIIAFKNAGHRFVQLANVTIQGGVQSPQSKPGALVFDVPAGTQQVTLNVTIPPQAPGAKKNILTVSQTYSLSTLNGKFGMFERGLSHPRVRSLGFASTKPLVIRVDLDLEFLDVTDHVRTLAPTYATFLADTQGKDGGCVTVLLEHTANVPGKTAQDAFSWAIVIPPAAVRKDIDTNVFLFFQNELLLHMLPPNFATATDRGLHQPYVNSDDVAYDRATTFLNAQGKKDPTFGGVQVGPSYLTRKVNGSTTSDTFSETPRPFGWFGQIANSEKAGGGRNAASKARVVWACRHTGKHRTAAAKLAGRAQRGQRIGVQQRVSSPAEHSDRRLELGNGHAGAMVQRHAGCAVSTQ